MVGEQLLVSVEQNLHKIVILASWRMIAIYSFLIVYLKTKR